MAPPMKEMDAKPRKMPRQSRAKATVEAIVEATAQLLLEEGYSKFTTARVAERAGVSVGSLYQYFPNKAALAAALIDRSCDDFLTAFARTLAGRRHSTLAECISAMVEENLVSHHLTPALHRTVQELAPRLNASDRIEQISRDTARLIEALLLEHHAEIDPAIDLATAAMVIETVLEALAHRIGLADPAFVSKDALACETVRLITRYLATSSPRRGPNRVKLR
jgi:AcrR family transcriptional regulator